MDRLWDISRQIGARRKRLGLSLSQLARRANTSPATLSRYENGWSRFEISTLRKLATALDCDLVVKLQPRPRWVEQPTPENVVQQIRRLFGDQEPSADHLEQNPLRVVERVLEYGGLGDIRILTAYFGRDSFLRLVGKARFSSARTRELWRSVLEREGVVSTKKSSRNKAASYSQRSNR